MKLKYYVATSKGETFIFPAFLERILYLVIPDADILEDFYSLNEAKNFYNEIHRDVEYAYLLKTYK